MSSPAAEAAEALRAEEEVVEPWPADPEVPGRPEPEPIPLDPLAPTLRAWAESVAASVQVSPDMTGVLSLCAVSAAVAGKVQVRVDGAHDREWVTLYAVLVADPAERKSPAFRHLTEPLRAWETERAREIAPRHRAALEVVDVAETRLRATRAAAARDSATMDEVEAASLKLEEAHAKVPTIPELLASDSTPEALVRQMAEQGGRVAVLSPEGGPLRILDGRYSDGAARLEELAQAYDGELLKSARIGRECPPVRRPALTLGVALQPSVLETVKNARSLRGQGIYGRISWVLPPSRMGERVDSSEVPPLDLHAARLYRDTLHTLLDWRTEVEEDGTPVPRVLTLSPAATATKRDYHYEVERGIGPGGELAGVTDWAGKLVGRAVRIAALLDLAARAGDGRPLVDPISGWAMEGAVRICRALTTHALAVYGEMAMDQRTADLAYVLGRIRDLPGGATESELRRAAQGRRSIDGAEGLADLLDELEERGCVRRIHRPSTGGRPPSPRIALHPSLCTESAESAESGPQGGPGVASRTFRNADARGTAPLPPDPDEDPEGYERWAVREEAGHG